MSEPLRFVLPMPKNIANARMHWRAKDNARKAYLAQLDLWQAMKLVPVPPQTPFKSAAITSVMRLKNRMDHDNAMARHKWALDWLQSRGYIANDRDLQWSGLPEQDITRNADSVLILTLTPL